MKRKGSNLALAAINEAAREKNISYGKFVATTPQEELERIISEYQPKPQGVKCFR